MDSLTPLETAFLIGAIFGALPLFFGVLALISDGIERLIRAVEKSPWN